MAVIQPLAEQDPKAYFVREEAAGMDPHHYRVRRAALGLETGAIIAVIPGLYVRQVWPERRELPKNYGGVLFHDLAGNFVAIAPVIPSLPFAPSPRRRASQRRTLAATTRDSSLHLVRS